MQPTAGLIGRDAELAHLLELVPACPLITLTGVGGVGKTTLALRVAELIGASFDGGVRICELAYERDPDAIPMVVAGQLGLPSLDAAATAYSDASMVVVLDNCEHVLDAAAAVASTLLAAGTGVCVLTTSREPLGLPSERVVPIDVLEVPASDDPADVQRSPAARLFLARALASGAPITLDATTAAPIASVCRRLDGLPLALRLAAARSRTLTPTEIDRHLDDRFRLLASRQARGPERHRSQRAAIDWSYDLLDPDEQRFFDALGIFDDRFSADAARTVAALDDEPLLTVLSRLDDLVQRSLLTVVPSPLGSRYRLLESLREYGRERLAGGGDLAATRQRYLDHLTQVATEIHAAFRAAWTPEPVLRLLIEYENLRAATEWCAANDATPHRAFTLFLPQFLAIDNARARPVAELGQRLLGRWPDPVDPLWPDMLAVTATALATDGDVQGAQEIAQRAAGAAAGGFAAVVVNRLLCLLENNAGRPAEALQWAEEADRVARTDGTLPPFACELLAWRAQELYHLRRFDAALATALAMREEAARIGGASLEVSSALVHACMLVSVDDAAAAHLFDAALRMARDSGYTWGLRNGLRARGAAALIAGDPVRAAGSLLAALEAFVSTGNDGEIWWTLRWIAALLIGIGDRATAATLLTARPANPPVMIMNMLEHRFLPGLLAGLDRHPSPPATLRDAVALARATLTAVAVPDGGAAGTEPPAGDTATSHPLPAAPPAADATTPDRFTLDGEYWTITFDGRTCRLRDTKGVRDLARLLGTPGREIHCLDLMGSPVVERDTGPTVDATARRVYEARIVTLRAELEEAEAAHDLGRAERARDELDALVDQLAAASGLGGRARRSGASAERARSAVGWRIRAALRRLTEADPALGRHLGQAVQLGTWCSYRPGEPRTWQV